MVLAFGLILVILAFILRCHTKDDNELKSFIRLTLFLAGGWVLALWGWMFVLHGKNIFW